MLISGQKVPENIAILLNSWRQGFYCGYVTSVLVEYQYDADVRFIYRIFLKVLKIVIIQSNSVRKGQGLA